MLEGPQGDASYESHAEASRSVKAVQLRLLMKEREGVVSRLVELDYNIWVLEEFFRADNPPVELIQPPGTVVPKGSLSSREGKPR